MSEELDLDALEALLISATHDIYPHVSLTRTRLDDALTEWEESKK